MSIRLRPVAGLRGGISVPGDKSISHRAVICNAMAPGRATVQGFLTSDDCLHTIACLRALGVTVHEDVATLVVDSPGLAGLREAAGPLDCGNSGTTMRLLAGVAAALDAFTVLDGDGSLRRRPMDRVLEPLAGMGARVDGRGGGRLAPISVRGGRLRPYTGRLRVASAQVKSAVLLAALAADGASEVEEPAPTRDHTEIMLGAMGAAIDRDGARIHLRPGPLHPVDLTVPGDFSAAAFWLVAGSIVPGSEIRLEQVGVNPTRTGALDVLRAMGAEIRLDNPRRAGGEPVADLTVRSAPLRGTAIAGDLTVRAIDELPVLAVAAAFAAGPTEIRDAAELRVKESDRVASTAAVLRALGAAVEERPDGLRVAGGRALHAGVMDSVGDHRLAMAAAVAALALPAGAGVSEVRGEDSVVISYPTFWQDVAALAGAGALA